MFDLSIYESSLKVKGRTASLFCCLRCHFLRPFAKQSKNEKPTKSPKDPPTVPRIPPKL